MIIITKLSYFNYSNSINALRFVYMFDSKSEWYLNHVSFWEYFVEIDKSLVAPLSNVGQGRNEPWVPVYFTELLDDLMHIT